MDVRASYVEVLNENVYDLLAESSSASAGAGPDGAGGRAARLREESDGSFFVENLTIIPLVSVSQALSTLTAGFSARRTSATAMNARSSRSHAILSISVEVRKTMEEGVGGGAGSSGADGARTHVHAAILDIVDLAGSERQRDTGAEGAVR